MKFTALCHWPLLHSQMPPQTLQNILRKSYSGWVKKLPRQSQFSADIDGEKYKTTITIENQTDPYLLVDSYATFGFKLNNGFRIIGPCALFPKTALSWNVGGTEDIHLASLSLFTALEPKIDLLVVGVGEPEAIKYVDRRLYKQLRDKGIGLELLSTHQACATFNFLNNERRCVAAALFPPRTLPSSNLDEAYFLPENYDNMERKSEYYIDPTSGEKHPISAPYFLPDEDLKKQQEAELPESYADSPEERPKKLTDSKSKPKPQLPDGKTKT